jgi:hypothetical protein
MASIHKGKDNLLLVFYEYHSVNDPHSQVSLVGSTSSGQPQIVVGHSIMGHLISHDFSSCHFVIHTLATIAWIFLALWNTDWATITPSKHPHSPWSTPDWENSVTSLLLRWLGTKAQSMERVLGFTGEWYTNADLLGHRVQWITAPAGIPLSWICPVDM